MVNEKSSELSELSNQCDQILKDKHFEEALKIFKDGLSTEKETNKKLISALTERCIKDSLNNKGLLI